MEPWARVEAKVLRLRRHQELWVAASAVPHPLESGYYGSIGLNRQASRHFRRRVVNLRGIHVLDFGDHYRVHWDRIDPSVSVTLHFLDDVLFAFGRFCGRVGKRIAGRPLPGPVHYHD